MRSRSLRYGLELVEPGASVQARVTRKGLAGSVIVPEIVRIWPLAVKVSAGS